MGPTYAFIATVSRDRDPPSLCPDSPPTNNVSVGVRSVLMLKTAELGVGGHV